MALVIHTYTRRIVDLPLPQLRNVAAEAEEHYCAELEEQAMAA